MLWPALARVDVRSARDQTWVLKDVGTVDVIPGIEVVFRARAFSCFLFVSTNGWVNMVAG